MLLMIFFVRQLKWCSLSRWFVVAYRVLVCRLTSLCRRCATRRYAGDVRWLRSPDGEFRASQPTRNLGNQASSRPHCPPCPASNRLHAVVSQRDVILKAGMPFNLRLHSRRTAAIAAMITATIGMAAVIGHKSSGPTPGPSLAIQLRRATEDLKRGNLDGARKNLAVVLVQEPGHPEALVYWGEMERQSGDPDAAVAAWEKIPDSSGSSASKARYLMATLMLERHRARDAERLFRRSIDLGPRYLPPHEQLLNLFVMQMRADAIRAELSAIEKLRPLTVREMLLDVVADRRVLDAKRGSENVSPFVDADPADLHSRIALARYWTELSRTNEAIGLLDQPLPDLPEADEARALLAQLRAEAGDVPAARKLFDADPPGDESPAPVWFAFGRVLELSGDTASAAAAYAAAVRKRPTDGPICYRLGQMLQRLGRRDDAEAQLERAQLLEALYAEAQLFGRSLAAKRPPAALSVQMIRVADASARLGQAEDSAAWYRRALEFDPGNIAARVGLRRPSSPAVALSDKIPSTEAGGLPAQAAPAAKADLTSAAADSQIQLVDRHADAGIEFTYFNGETGFKYLVETVGGGVAVLDYDGDGWPDLYFCQGSDLPHNPSNRERSDRLFRNRGDGTFVDVTQQAGIAEHGYSIGCAAADVDDDGFPDMYVTNHGRSMLFVNNGDGTFRDATQDAGLDGERMASSAAFADFDGDGNLDLYVVTYVESLRICRGPDGGPRPCDPAVHEGPPDNLYRNVGDGTFIDVSAESGVAEAANGKGLGVLVADFDEDRRPDIYVANDTTPNFLFFNRTSPGGPIRFDERGLSSGAALNMRGEAEAGMGIACADFDGNGLLDLHVTNFYTESNTLYLNWGGGLFEDASRVAGLTERTQQWLGFGTQAADFDLDGVPDLYVANGHIVKPQVRGQPWKMPAQLFRNTGAARFKEVSSTAGAYFSERCLGRGVARLDWNRDGRPDLAAVHQDRPAALLTNETPDAGAYLRVRLYGVESNRDAIGARLNVTAGGRTQTVEICGGDGIMCSNERVQVIGVGTATSVDRLEVFWPSGRKTVSEKLPVRQELRIIEGRRTHSLVGAVRMLAGT